jgi:hypothetical protein
MTAEPGGHPHDGLLALGADRVFRKPFPLDELAASLHSLFPGLPR